VKSCPVEAVTMQEAADEHEATALHVASIDSVKCIRCGSCATVCPKKAIRRI